MPLLVSIKEAITLVALLSYNPSTPEAEPHARLQHRPCWSRSSSSTTSSIGSAGLGSFFPPLAQVLCSAKWAAHLCSAFWILRLKASTKIQYKSRSAKICTRLLVLSSPKPQFYALVGVRFTPSLCLLTNDLLKIHLALYISVAIVVCWWKHQQSGIWSKKRGVYNMPSLFPILPHS